MPTCKQKQIGISIVTALYIYNYHFTNSVHDSNLSNIKLIACFCFFGHWQNSVEKQSLLKTILQKAQTTEKGLFLSVILLKGTQSKHMCHKVVSYLSRKCTAYSIVWTQSIYDSICCRFGSKQPGVPTVFSAHGTRGINDNYHIFRPRSDAGHIPRPESKCERKNGK